MQRPIYRHEAKERDWITPKHAAQFLQEVEVHVEKYIGMIGTVFHEIVSDVIHLDVLFVPATTIRPYHVLITSGVSDEPMKVPAGMEQYRRAELLIALPKEWPLEEDSFKDEANYWPIRWLKDFGRLPHDYETWTGWGHSLSPVRRIPWLLPCDRNVSIRYLCYICEGIHRQERGSKFTYSETRPVH